MNLKGIMKKWFIDVVSVMSVIFIIFFVILNLIISRSYYRAVETMLSTNSYEMLSAFFDLRGDDSSGSFATSAREFIEDFSRKDIMEVWVIDSNGKVILSSSGFEIGEVDMPDYAQALSLESGRGKWRGKLANGEKIMAETALITYSGGANAGAVRFMISLADIDTQLLYIAIFSFAACVLLLLMFIFITSRFFYKSVLFPVRSVCDTAVKIAEGDLDARIEGYSDDDEIGMLCETFNNMATDLATADKMKNDFLSTVSHELRTPLTAIQGWGETILQIGTTDPNMAKRGMEVIVEETARLNGMVEELLDFSRMNSGRMVLKIERIDILAELDEIVFTLKDNAVKMGIEISYAVPPVPIPMNGDAARIKQVFVNILDNAIKYNHQGGHVAVKAEIVRPSSLIITVADDGKGISAEDLPKVKEKFFKADYTVRGSGIGLAVVDEIVKLHNGEFTIDSVLGQGTTVTVTLPVDPIPEEEGENITDE